MILKNGKTYYTLEESIKISDEYIEKSADNLISDLKKVQQELTDKNKVYV